MVDLSTDDLLNTRTAARLLAVSEDTLKAWRSRKQGPPYLHLEGAIRYLRSDLERYIESQMQRPAS